MLSYREQFKPSATLRQAAMRSSRCAVVCADSDAEAERLATTHRSQFRAPRAAANICRSRARRRRAAYPLFAGRPRALSRSNRARLFVGTPATVLARLEPLIEATKADEVMVTTMIYDHAARRHSYELLAEAFGLDAGKNERSTGASSGSTSNVSPEPGFAFTRMGRGSRPCGSCFVEAKA